MKRRLIYLVMLLAFSITFVSVTSLPDAGPVPTHPIEATILRMQESMVRISMRADSEQPYRHIGSGFVATEDGLIATAGHVANKGGEYLVSFADGTDVQAEVRFVSDLTDCAVLKVRGRGLAAASIRSTQPFIGENVYVIGSPWSALLSNYVTRGIVSKLRISMPTHSALDLFSVDAPVNPGNSGGPVFDTDGHVVGIAIAKVGGYEGLGFAVYGTDVADIIEKAAHVKANESRPD